MITLDEPLCAGLIDAQQIGTYAPYFYKKVSGKFAVYHRELGFMLCVDTKAELQGIVSTLQKFEFQQDNSHSKCQTMVTYDYIDENGFRVLYVADGRSGLVLTIVENNTVDHYPVIRSAVKYPSPDKLTDDILVTLRDYFYWDCLDDAACRYINEFIKRTDEKKLKYGFNKYFDIMYHEEFLSLYYDFDIQCEKIL